MKIGELATRAGVDVQTIRYYEREGLIMEPPRTNAGYRVYGEEDFAVLSFIRHCRSLDITLAERRILLDFRAHPDRTCEDVDRIIAKHVEEVQKRIAVMQLLEQQLCALKLSCGETRTVAQCGILQSLDVALD